MSSLRPLTNIVRLVKWLIQESSMAVELRGIGRAKGIALQKLSESVRVP